MTPSSRLPVDTEELVTAEALWISMRAGVFGCVPMIVAIFFGLDPSWGMLLVPFIAFISGFGWANFGIAIAGFAKSYRELQLHRQRRADAALPRRRHVLPHQRAARVGAGAGQPEPAVPVRRARTHAVFGTWEWVDLLRVGMLVAFGLAMWRIAIFAMERKLVD